MFETLIDWHAVVNGWVWGPYTMAILMGAGLYFTVLTGAVQVTRIAAALREVLGKILSPSAHEGTVTPFQAVATALASTVGVGNVAGVATAITLGGPGALFWLIVSGLLGMATKFSEIVVAITYRRRDETGTFRGGAMYILRDGLGLPRLGALFALLTALAGFGIGNMVQANSVAEALRASFDLDSRVTGVFVVVLTGAVIIGGIRRIADVTQILVPFMCLAYLLGAGLILIRYADRIPEMVALVVGSAFTGQAAVGGFAGATVLLAVRYGVARGLFSNEAGLGSAPIVHAAARTDHPVRQGLYGIFEVFVDTVLVCSFTGLVILTTGVWTGDETGAALSARAFETGLPGLWGGLIVTVAIVTFAYSTLLGWSYYGETAAGYLFGTRVILPYRLLWLVFAYLGATGSLHLIWDVSDTMNGLMAIPNLVAILGSSAVIRRAIRDYGRPAGTGEKKNV
jgi:alanine or glycine:cation symporter, AGCS family